MQKYVQKLRANPFLMNNLIYFSGSLGVSFLNYLYYPILARLMLPADFGEVQTIISIFTQAAVFLQVLGLVSIGIINKYHDEAERDALIAELSRLSLALSLVVFVITIFAAPAFKAFFRFAAISPFIVLGLCLLVSVAASFANAYLQAHHRFATLTRGQLIGTIGKLVFSIILVVAGLKAFGAITGLLLASLISLTYALSRGQGIRHFVSSNLHLRRPRLAMIKPELPYAVLVFISALTINIFLSLDIVVVKHYFPPNQAGLYTGISIISNIIYFVTGPFAGVLLPSIKIAQSPSHNRQILLRSIGLCLLIGGSALAIFSLLPHLVVGILLGQRYQAFASYLPRLSLALFLMSVSNLLIYYYVALRRYLVAPVLVASLAITLFLLSHAHGTMGMVVNDLVIGAFILIMLLIALTAIPVNRKFA